MLLNVVFTAKLEFQHPSLDAFLLDSALFQWVALVPGFGPFQTTIFSEFLGNPSSRNVLDT